MTPMEFVVGFCLGFVVVFAYLGPIFKEDGATGDEEAICAKMRQDGTYFAWRLGETGI